MNNFEQVLDFIFSVQVWGIAKLFVCLALLLYIVFSLIVVRQVDLMAKTLMVPIALPIKTVTIFHLGLAIFVFLLALVML